MPIKRDRTLVPAHQHDWYPICWFSVGWTPTGELASWSGAPALFACGAFMRCVATRTHRFTPAQRAEKEGRACADHTHKTLDNRLKCTRRSTPLPT